MWYISCKSTSQPKFYTPQGELVDVPEVWVNEFQDGNIRVWSSTPMIGNSAQAVKRLYEVGAACFMTKSDAKVFTRGLKPYSWKYVQIKL